MNRRLMYSVFALPIIIFGSGCLSIYYHVPSSMDLTQRDGSEKPKIAVKLDKYGLSLFPNIAVRKAFEDSGYQLDSNAETIVSISHSTEVGRAYQFWAQCSGMMLGIIPAYIPAKRVFTATVGTTTVTVNTRYDTILWIYLLPLYGFYEMTQQNYLYNTTLEIIRSLQKELAIPIPQ